MPVAGERLPPFGLELPAPAAQHRGIDTKILSNLRNRRLWPVGESDGFFFELLRVLTSAFTHVDTSM